MDKLLEIKDLRISLLTPYGRAYGVRGVSLDIAEGEKLGIVGESGCGKTLTAKAILGLHRRERTEISGSIVYKKKNGETVDLLRLREPELRKIRGSDISMVLQDSSLALSPIITVGRQMEDMILAHRAVGRHEAGRIAAKLLGDVGLSEPEMRLKCLPGELSGGQLQRICIAMAISSDPRLLIADEPTTALDAVTQAQILELLKNISAEKKMAVMLVTHNFSVIKRFCDRVCVMYAGEVAERGKVAEVTEDPRHRYTQGLLKSIPDGRKRRLEPLAGSLPDVYERITGCAFSERCPDRREDCRGEIPEISLGGTHCASCVLAGGEPNGG